jgi:hypothetical protein
MRLTSDMSTDDLGALQEVPSQRDAVKERAALTAPCGALVRRMSLSTSDIADRFAMSRLP